MFRSICFNRAYLRKKGEHGMAMIAMATPFLPGKTEQWRHVVAELKGARHQEFVASRQPAGVREHTFFQSTPQGDMVIIVLEGADLQQAVQEILAADEFSRTSAQQSQELLGMDFSQPPPGPRQSLCSTAKPDAGSYALRPP
jgi:hypothetical protein